MIVVSFAGIVFVGLIVVGVTVGLLSWAGLGISADWRLWLTLALIAVPITLVSTRPADRYDHDQPWTVYVVRAVMIGDQHEWSLWWRIALALVFGPGLLGYAVVFAVQRVLGLV